MARKKNQDDSSQDPNNSDDTFGLPEIEYQPINRETTSPGRTEAASEPTYTHTETQTQMENEPQNEYNTYYEEEEESPWPKILAISGFILITAAAIYYFGFYRPGKAKVDKQNEQAQADSLARVQREADLAEQRRIEAERKKADSLAALTPATGVIDTLTERTGRYYVVVASSVDGDLILDYAKKLAPKGVAPKIIPPHGKVKFYRLAIADGDTYAGTQATADSKKGEYGEGVWVVKY